MSDLIADVLLPLVGTAFLLWGFVYVLHRVVMLAEDRQVRRFIREHDAEREAKLRAASDRRAEREAKLRAALERRSAKEAKLPPYGHNAP